MRENRKKSQENNVFSREKPIFCPKFAGKLRNYHIVPPISVKSSLIRRISLFLTVKSLILNNKMLSECDRELSTPEFRAQFTVKPLGRVLSYFNIGNFDLSNEKEARMDDFRRSGVAATKRSGDSFQAWKRREKLQWRQERRMELRRTVIRIEQNGVFEY